MYILASLMPLLKRTVVLSDSDDKKLIITACCVKSLMGRVWNEKVHLWVNLAGVRHFFVVLD
jgi:hypothetical protein